jgi:hypothetical protein
VAPSRLRAPISPFKPLPLSAAGVERQIRAFVNAACKAREGGYDGVEIMGSEGYFINEFLSAATNQRSDAWGGDYSQRMRLPVEIVERTRAAVGPDFILIFRLSMIDLVPGGSSWDETVQLGTAVARGGASLINTGIGWHEARVPTIATSVPRAAFAWVTQKMKSAFSAAGLATPLITSNRINTPEVAEQVLADGCADMVSMARPLLADAHFVRKAAAGRAADIAPCIACNQACLDHIFQNQLASCLVNPRACHETLPEMTPRPAAQPRRIAVVGAGPAGLTAAAVAAERGHQVDLFDAASQPGGQLQLARQVPGKEEFDGLLHWLARHPHPRRAPAQPEEPGPGHPHRRADRWSPGPAARARAAWCSTRSTPKASGATSRPSAPTRASSWTAWTARRWTAVEGVPPAIAIDQTNPVRTSRSTVGTMTELNDHLKLLFARAAQLFDRRPRCRCGTTRPRASTPTCWRAAEAAGDPRAGLTFPVELPATPPRPRSSNGCRPAASPGAGRARGGGARTCWTWWPTASASGRREGAGDGGHRTGLKRGGGRPTPALPGRGATPKARPALALQHRPALPGERPALCRPAAGAVQLQLGLRRLRAPAAASAA